MQSYLYDIEHVRDTGTPRMDRTGTGTTAATGIATSYDLKKGFPLTTTKKTFFKGIVRELEWLVKGDTSNNNLVAAGCKIWNEWADANGNLGPIYGAQWRRRPVDTAELVVVKPILRESLNVDEDFEFEKDPTYYYCMGGEQGLKRYGRVLPVNSNANDRVFTLWCGLLPYHCFSLDWRTFENFKRDISKVPGYEQWYSGQPYDLSIEYFAADVFAIETVMFLKRDFLSFNYATIKDKNGVERYFRYNNVVGSVFEDETIYRSCDNKVLPDGSLVRPKLYVDQLQDVIDLLKSDPTSRRIIVDSWNPEVLPYPFLSPKDNANLGRQALPPCHTLFQFTVDTRKDGGYDLNCVLYMRSNDVFLGRPFNIASYALLTMAIAKIVGMGLGKFHIMSGDTHIYDNHREQIEEQLSRVPYELPTVTLSDDIKSLADIVEANFQLNDYQSHPPLKGDVAI